MGMVTISRKHVCQHARIQEENNGRQCQWYPSTDEMTVIGW